MRELVQRSEFLAAPLAKPVQRSAFLAMPYAKPVQRAAFLGNPGATRSYTQKQAAGTSRRPDTMWWALQDLNL